MNRSDVFGVNERPGKGIYRCVERPQWVVRLDDAIERLPPCYGELRFQNVHYQRIVDLSTAITAQEMRQGL